jgi:hypothetical protein
MHRPDFNDQSESQKYLKKILNAKFSRIGFLLFFVWDQPCPSFSTLFFGWIFQDE